MSPACNLHFGFWAKANTHVKTRSVRLYPTAIMYKKVKERMNNTLYCFQDYSINGDLFDISAKVYDVIKHFILTVSDVVP